MFGFLGKIYKENININDSKDKQIISEGRIYFENRMINKFINDKLFFNNNDYTIILDGVIFNKQYFINIYNHNCFSEVIIKMYNEIGENFFNNFRGSFSGIFFDKENDKIIIFTDHIGDKQIFYYNSEKVIFIGSELKYIIELMKNDNIEYSFDINGAYYLLTYGFMLEDVTLINEIRKLNPGQYIVIDKNNKLQIKEYYKLNNKLEIKEKEKEKEILQNIDTLFRQAVKRQFDKDLEYNYNHISSLSGGLDSRMTTWVAHEMGYKNMLNLTFSQTNYLDENIAKDIAINLKHDWIFKSLDNGNFIEQLPQTIKINDGMSTASGLIHGNSFYNLLDFSKFGIFHTGQLGDVVIGTFFKNNIIETFQHGDGAYSKRLIDKIKQISLKNKYENSEIFKFYGRGFNGANQGLLSIMDKTETYSPFYDVDLMDYCLKIPLKFRNNHYIYFEWIKKFYPEATNYKWEKINAKITDKSITFKNIYIPMKQIPKYFLLYFFRRIIKNKNYGISGKNNMNPYEYWFKTNNEFRKVIETLFINKISIIKKNKELYTDCYNLYNNGSTLEKIQVISFLEAYNNFFGEKNE